MTPLRVQLVSHFPVKVRAFAWTIGVMLCLYMLPQLVVVVEPTQIADSWIDAAVPFAPGWTPIYVSFYGVIVLGFLLAPTPADAWRCLRGTLVMYVPTSILFFCVQVEGPRPTGVDGGWLWNLLTILDANLNTLPSLHAAIVLFFSLLAHPFTRETAGGTRTLLLVGLWLWTALILYATLATKQHRFVDLPTGAALGALAAFVVTRSPSSA